MIILLLLFSLRNTPTALEQEEEEEEEGVRRRGHDLQGFLTSRHSHGHPANLSTSGSSSCDAIIGEGVGRVFPGCFPLPIVRFLNTVNGPFRKSSHAKCL